MRPRVTLAATAALLLALTGTACSANSTGTSSATAGGTTSATGNGFPATVATKFGDVVISAKPKRVVALGWGDARTALSLGVQPVGASDWLGFGGEGVGPWLAGKYANPPELIGTMEPSYGAIAAL